jgi:NDP-sugar pyrophosphorylase family protein
VTGRNGRHSADDFGLVASLSHASTVHSIKTVILAGGKGTRLRPYTAVLPKPLMPLGDRAILELVVHHLAEQGFVDITLSVGHLAHLIEAVFGNGDKYGVDIRYIREDTPLGTAGSLRLVEGLDETFLVLNGDLVTTLEYRNLVRSHRASGNVLTIAAKNRQAEMDYGVLSLEPGSGPTQAVVGYQEKPVFDCMVSMGIYVLEPQALEFIPEGGYFDFPDLVQALLAAGAPVGGFVYEGLWLDIGRHDDYEQAVALWGSTELGPLANGQARNGFRVAPGREAEATPS